MANRSAEQLATIITRSTKEHQLEMAKKYGISSDVLAGATFGLGVVMMFESGHSEEDIVAQVRELLGDLSASPSHRGAS